MATLTVSQAFDLSLQHYRAGRLADAEALARQILAVQPQHGDALHLLGVLTTGSGRDETAVEFFLRAIAVMPAAAAVYSNLGVAYRNVGRLPESIAALRTALRLQPEFAEASSNLGNALLDVGQVEEAAAAYRRAIQLKPDYGDAYGNLGNALKAQGQMAEAVAAYRRALQLRPGFPEAHNNLGNALARMGQVEEAIAAYRRAIQLRPGYVDAYSNLSVALGDQGNLEEAIAMSRRAIQLQPGYAEAHYNLANFLRETSRLDEAIQAYRRAIQLRPDYVEAHNNLGVALTLRGNLDEAIVARRRVLALQPESAEAHNNLGSVLKEQGRIAEALASYRRALELRPDFVEAHSNLLLGLHYLPDADAAEVFAEHRRWDARHAQPLAGLIHAHSNDRDPERRLRVGYLSPDFRAHSTSFFLEGLLAAHDRVIFCYAHTAREDAVSERLRGYAGHWQRIKGLSDAQSAELIRRDGIDILVDLAGHTANNRLSIFARKPAPIQVTWLGYPDTTGMRTMDYRFTDALADPPGATEYLHAEKLVRLPECAWCYLPAGDAPAVSPSPGSPTRSVTFGCFNAFQKINEPLLALWAGLLKRTPGTRLLLKNHSLTDGTVQARVRGLLEQAGVASERLELLGHTTTTADHLAAYRRMDIALDTFPYHGTTTTCEALWMGVPVITLAGKTHVSRVGVSLLTNANLPELIANSPEEYSEIASRLADDVGRRVELRTTLRARMALSPLMDAAHLAHGVENAYRQMWREWCARRSSDALP